MANEKQGMLLEEMKNAFIGKEIEERFMERREIFLWSEVNDETAKKIVQKILYFDGLNNKDITLFINSPGGSISAGLAIYDAMRYAKSDLITVCMGQAASMGAVLLCAGAEGKRYAWENARVMIHQPLISGNIYAPASDIQIQADEMLRIRSKLNDIIAYHCQKKAKQIEADTDRDFWFSAPEAMSYGLVDHVSQGRD